MNGIYLRNKIQDIKTRLTCGYIYTLEHKNIKKRTLPKEATPFIDEMNRLGAEIAKKFGKKFSKFTFVNLMR